jgi:hypothetical protein
MRLDENPLFFNDIIGSDQWPKNWRDFGTEIRREIGDATRLRIDVNLHTSANPLFCIWALRPWLLSRDP